VGPCEKKAGGGRSGEPSGDARWDGGVALVRSRTPRWLVTAGIALGVWAVALLAAFFEMLPYVPRTRRDWTLFILLAPPAYIVCSWIGERRGALARNRRRLVGPPPDGTQRIEAGGAARVPAAIGAAASASRRRLPPRIREPSHQRAAPLALGHGKTGAEFVVSGSAPLGARK